MSHKVVDEALGIGHTFLHEHSFSTTNVFWNDEVLAGNHEIIVVRGSESVDCEIMGAAVVYHAFAHFLSENGEFQEALSAEPANKAVAIEGREETIRFGELHRDLMHLRGLVE
jgi:hypothetical protein